MSFIECPKCKKEIQDDFKICPYCKTKLKTTIENEKRIKINSLIISIMVISLFINIIQAILYFTQNKSTKIKDTTNTINAIDETSTPDTVNMISVTDNIVDSKDQEIANSTFDDDKISTEFDVKQLKWIEEYINVTYYHCDLVITNNTQKTYVIKYDIEYYDKENNVIGSSSGETRPVAAGQPYYVSAYLDDQDFEYIKYKISPEPSYDVAFNPSYITAEVKSTGAKGKYVASLTNKDSYDYEFAGVNVVFYSGDTIVAVEKVYTTNSDYLLPSGETITNDFKCRKENDRIECYIFGRYAD